MLDDTHASLAVGATGLALIFLFLVPSLQRLLHNLRTVEKKEYHSLYEDADGITTEKAEAEYSVKYVQIAVCIASAVGLVTSTALAVMSTMQHTAVRASVGTVTLEWLLSAAWMLTSIRAIILILERHPIQRFKISIAGAVSGVILLCMGLFPVGLDYHKTKLEWNASMTLNIIQAASALLVATAFMFLPRRPDVFLPDGKLVERQRKVSVLSRIAFNWPTAILDLAQSRQLDMTDLPSMDSTARSRDRHEAFMTLKRGRKLWQRLFFAHWPQFIMSWTIVLLQSLFSFVPRLAVLSLLRILERRTGAGKDLYIEAWLWVAVLAVSNILATVLDTQMTWTMWSELGIPIRSELGALIFSKAMKRKDSKEPPKAEKPPIDGQTSPNVEAGGTNNTKKAGKEKDSKPRSEQGTINLIAVDAMRIAQMAAFTLYLWMIAFKFVLAVAFLWALIGWQSTLVGLATNVICLPLNAYCAKRYSDSQQKLMEARDKKVGVVTESLQGIRQVKFAALERQWENRLNEVRKKELIQLWTCFVADTLQRLAYTAGPILLAVAALSSYVGIYGDLPASVAFTALGVFGQLEGVIGMIPDFVTFWFDAKISADRVDEFFDTPEKVVNRETADSISFENASITFPSDEKLEDRNEPFTLGNVNLNFPNNELSVISGKTGSGKSLLLAAILGEVDVIGGIIRVPKGPTTDERHDHKAVADNWIIPSSIAFVSQIPWIENASIKDNVLFGLPFDPIRYEKVIQACALTKDLEMLEDGDLTEVGAQGISLSGGQRWRLTFARALYSRAQILVMDDLFSALDAHVGKHIYEKALTGELAKDRTRILVTHHVALCLPKTKYAVLLGNGTVERAGMVEELERSGGLKELLKTKEEVVGPEVEDGTEPTESKSATNEEVDVSDKKPVVSSNPKKLVEEEKRETGGISKKVYMGYIKASGGLPFWIFIFFFFIIAQALALGRSWWVKLWTSSYESSIHTFFHQEPTMLSLVNGTALPVSSGKDTLGFYLGIYVAISVASILLSTLRVFWIFTGSIRASRIVFQDLAFTILRMPLRWIDTVPLGRILNRFTADFSTIDSRLAHDLANTASSAFQVAGTVVAGIFVSPYIIILAIVLLALCMQIARRYLNGAREVKRLESVFKSPIFEQFGSALKGVSTIRAFGNSEVYTDKMYERIDKHTTAFWHISLFNRWMLFRMSMVGTIFSAAIGAFVVSNKGVSASLAGFALTFSLEFSQGVIYGIYSYTNTELDMNAAERVMEYANLQTETQEGVEVPASWPSEGKLEVKDLVVGYAEGLPDILKGLSFSIDKRQRVGIVGRTGAGKSSLTLAVYRFLEARSGSIHIDGIDISQIKLYDLRNRLAIIPQDPVLFSGTIRSNIDPFDQLEDHALKEALERVHLTHSPASRDEPTDSSTATNDTNVNIFDSLSSPISEGGGNLSQGQRQLLCLARAIVARPKIMLLDEATSAVDMATDLFIQRSIREEFSNTTLIVIAHRLSTIADFDRILVLEDGKAVEFGPPEELLEKRGVFWGMVGDSGEKGRIEEMIREGGRRS